jgi:hypothetical protein
MSIFLGARATEVLDTGLTAVFTLIVFFVSSLLKVGAEVTTLSGLFDRSLSRYRLKQEEALSRDSRELCQRFYLALRLLALVSFSESSFSSP